MKKYAFRVFYIGDHFQGFQRQPNGFAVENYLEHAFVAGGYIRSFKTSSYINASRTDTGVNALENIISLYCTKQPNLNQINSYFASNHDLLVYQYSEVASNFNPRRNKYKIYEYFVPKRMKIYNAERCNDFVGTHDFSTFIRSDGAGASNPWTQIEFFDIVEDDNYKILRIHGDSFGREQIRKMVGFLLDKRYSEYRVLDYLETGVDLDISPAPPHYLVLSKIVFDQPLHWQPNSVNTVFYSKMKNRLQTAYTIANLKKNVIGELLHRTNLS